MQLVGPSDHLLAADLGTTSKARASRSRRLHRWMVADTAAAAIAWVIGKANARLIHLGTPRFLVAAKREGLIDIRERWR